MHAPGLRRVGACAAALILAAVLPDAPIASALPVAPCRTREYRRLDFRIGRFDVATETGVRAGESVVAPILDGCALVESWTGAVSGRGSGLFYYDPAAARWRLIYLNVAGNVLDLAGAFAGDALVLTGEGMTFDGKRGMHRMTWSPLGDDGVRQLWEFSADHGAHWRRIFDGRFTRARRPDQNRTLAPTSHVRNSPALPKVEPP